MKIVVLNGSPKGEYSITLQYVNFLQKKFVEHQFQIINISQKIKKIKKDEKYFNEIIGDIKSSDAVLWSFGLWVLAVPAQYMRFIELITERKAEGHSKINIQQQFPPPSIFMIIRPIII